MLARRNQYLREMGIDVWVLRDDRPDDESNPAHGHQQEPAEPPTTAPAAPPPEFHLCFATYGRLSLVFAIPQSSTSLPGGLRRFVDDIALAAGITDKPSINALRWPMVKSGAMDQSESAARAVIEERLQNCGDIRLVFGESVANQVATGNETQLLEIERYLDEPARKRELWQTLKQVTRT